MKTKLISLFGVIILISMCLVLGTSNANAADKNYILKFQLSMGPMHPISKAVRELAPSVKKMSDGRLEIKVYDSGVLVGQEGQLMSVEKNVVDISIWWAMRQAKTIPFVNVGVMPLVYQNSATTIQTWKGGELCDLLEEELIAKGYKNVGVGRPFLWGFFGLGFVDKEVHVPSDLKGLKMLVRGDPTTNFIKSYGGAVVSTLRTSGVYEALSRGIIDGTWGTRGNFIDYKWMEPCKYYLNYPFCDSQTFLLWNKPKVNAMPQYLREIVYNFLESCARELSLIPYMVAENALPVLSENMKIYTPTPSEAKQWTEGRSKIIDDFLKITGERGDKAMEIIQKYNKPSM